MTVSGPITASSVTVSGDVTISSMTVSKHDQHKSTKRDGHI